MKKMPFVALALDFDAFELSIISKDKAGSAPVLSNDKRHFVGTVHRSSQTCPIC